MKILHLSTSDLDGGAARAAYRLHRGLQPTSTDSQMLVRAKNSADETVITDRSNLTKLGPKANSLPLKFFYPQRQRTAFSSQWFPDVLSAKIKKLQPDIIHLHWICNGFLQIETLAKLAFPLVWTLHDMWVFTGGCHYNGKCDRYTQNCGACPQLNSSKEADLSRWIWWRKAKAWKNIDLTLVAPSTWFAEQAKNSSLFSQRRVEVIPHGLDLTAYQPVEIAVARSLLDLPQDKHLILFGASSGITNDPRKGFHLLIPALNLLSKIPSQVEKELVIFGIAEPKTPIEVSLPVRYLGKFYDDLSLKLVYSAADVMVVPSMQESFGQTASEALACGTPVVAFNATGLKDVIAHQQDGYLAEPFVVEDLAKGIDWVLEEPTRHRELRDHARQKAEREFSLELQARRHLSLYEELLSA